jgi:D-alanyl-D-alanine dipeptidase
VNKSRESLPRLLLLCLCILLAAAPLFAQTATSTATSLIPGPKPADAPLEWKKLVGIYGKHSSVIILERDGKLFFRDAAGTERALIAIHAAIYETASPKTHVLLPPYHTGGSVPFIDVDEKTLRRADIGSSPGHDFHVTPTRPLKELQAAAVAATPPEEAGPFRKPELVELTTLDPAFHLDIRYAQANNFLSTPLYTQARAFMQRPAAEALLRVLRKLQPLGFGLLIHDAYRPWYITKLFWDATPPKDHSFVADPLKGSKHNRGCAVDLTLYDLKTGKTSEMPGKYDEMSPRSFPTFPGGTSLQRWHRDLLRRAVESEGFTVDQNEWWHFDYKEWKLYPILNVPFEKLDKLVN